MTQFPNGVLKRPNSDAIALYLKMMAQSTRTAQIAVGINQGGADYRWTSTPVSSASFTTPYEVGCIGKVLNFALVLELGASGKIDIDLPISCFLPELENTSVGNHVLVRHLLCGTAGYLGYPSLGSVNWKMTWDDFVTQLLAAPMIFKPGDVYSQDYSSYVLLAAIIQRVAGRPWMEVVDDTLGVPLFGRRLYRSDRAVSIWLGATFNIALSVDELAVLGQALALGTPRPGGRVFADSTVQKMNETAIRVPLLAGQTCWFPRGYGFGLAEYHGGLRGLCGRGIKQHSSIRLLPEQGMTLAVCVESANPMVRHTVVDGLLAELGISREPNIVSAPLPAGLSAEDLSGNYVGLRGFAVTVDVQRPAVRILMRSEGRPELTVNGTIDEREAFSLERQTAALGITFFRDPGSGSPAMMMGTSALRKDGVCPLRA